MRLISVMLLVLSLMAGGVFASVPRIEDRTAPPTPESASTGYFIKNAGQLPCDVLYYADVRGGRLYLRERDIVFQFVESSRNPQLPPTDRRHGLQTDPPRTEARAVANVYVRFPGGAFANVEAENGQAGRLNFMKGTDPSLWTTDVPTFGRIRIRDLYPGVSLVFDTGQAARSPWRFEITDADALAAVRVEVDASHPVAYEDGGLLLDSGFGAFSVAYPLLQAAGASPASTVLNPSGRVKSGPLQGRRPAGSRQEADGTRAAQQLLWGTYIGSGGDEAASSMALDGSGNIYLVGNTDIGTVPVPSGYDQTFNGGLYDFYVVKLAAGGASLLWGTFLGGTGFDAGYGIALDAAGNVVVGGETSSSDIPVPGGYDQHHHGDTYGFDIYVAKLTASGSSLLWGTYLGGSDFDACNALVLDGSGNVLVGGTTKSTDIPVPGGFQQSARGDYDLYAVKLSASGASLLWGTYLGGSGHDDFYSLALDASGNVVVAGNTMSADIPVPGGYDQAYSGGEYGDIYAAKLSSAGSSLLWGTYLGGSGDDYASTVVLDSAGDVIIGGATSSADIPVPGGYQQVYGGGDADIYVAKLAPSGASLLWATYLGGSGREDAGALAVKPSGDAVVAASTDSPDCPVPGGFQTAKKGKYDFYIAKLASGGGSLLWGTYLGGSEFDYPTGVRFDSSNNVVIGGYTYSADIPVPGGYDQTFNANDDFYVAKLSDPSGGGCTVTCTASASPAAGPVPLAVSFSASGTFAGCSGTPAYSWEFGDGATAAEQNPSHTYNHSGLLPWTMTVAVNGATCQRAGEVEVYAPGKCTGNPLFITAAAHVAGGGGSQWRTDLSLLNASTADGSISLKYLPQGSDNTTAACIGMGTLGAGASMAFNDVVLSTFGVNPGSGGIAIYSDSSNLMAMSRTYNQASSGTFGQGIPGRSAAQAIPTGRKGYLMQLHQNSAYRTNIGFLNPTSATLTLRVDFYNESGDFLGTQNYTLAPYEQFQDNQVFTKVTGTSVTNGRAEVKTTGGPVLAYASVVDNATGDGTYIEPF
jgi:hypothetical protein